MTQEEFDRRVEEECKDLPRHFAVVFKLGVHFASVFKEEQILGMLRECKRKNEKDDYFHIMTTNDCADWLSTQLTKEKEE